MNNNKRYVVTQHENGKEWFVLNTVDGYKVGFGALSFPAKHNADILALALDTAYLNGLSVGRTSATRELIDQFKDVRIID